MAVDDIETSPKGRIDVGLPLLLESPSPYPCMVETSGNGNSSRRRDTQLRPALMYRCAPYNVTSIIARLIFYQTERPTAPVGAQCVPCTRLPVLSAGWLLGVSAPSGSSLDATPGFNRFHSLLGKKTGRDRLKVRMPLIL